MSRHMFAFLVAYSSIFSLGSSTNCRDGWLAFRGSCYYFARQMAINFVQAENYCRQHDSHLIHIDSQLENTFIKDYMTGLQKESHWLGLTDEQIEGIWTWYDDQSDLSFSDWYRSQPDNHNGSEDCVMFIQNFNYQWADVACTALAEPVCEYRDPNFEGHANFTVVG